MDRNKLDAANEQLNKLIPSVKPKDGTITISWDLAVDLYHQVSRVLCDLAEGCDDEPSPAELAAVNSILLAREIRRIVGSAEDHRQRMRNAWHGVGALAHVADTEKHAQSGLQTLITTLNHFDLRTRELMDVTDGYEDGDDDAR